MVSRVGFYECRSCGMKTFLMLPELTDVVDFRDQQTPGGASHGPERACQGAVWDLIRRESD